MALKDVHIPIPRFDEDVTLHGKKELLNGIKVGDDLTLRRLSELSRWVQCT